MGKIVKNLKNHIMFLKDTDTDAKLVSKIDHP